MTTEPRVISRSDHPISRNQISANALKVLYRLNNSGFRACLVGGAVRDLLLGVQPKDFDIATDAKPEEVKSLFKNSRLIGRRFRLAHILYGREIIEVATFRGHHDEGSSGELHEDGRIIRDNVYGTIEEDAMRRDFTVNALFYDISNFTVLDYCDALADIERRQLRLIGDPVKRYQEDPVRMLRAIRLAAKLNLDIEAKTLEPIKQLGKLLLNISGGRLWDESQKMLLAGHSKVTFQQLESEQIIAVLLPQTHVCLTEMPFCRPFIKLALENTDLRIKEEKPVNPSFLYACFLWWPVQRLKHELMLDGYSPAEAMQQATTQVIEAQVKLISIPRRFTQFIRDVWLLQHRLESRRGKRITTLIQHKRFRAAYDFLVLRAKVKEIPSDSAEWWTQFQEVSAEEQSGMLTGLKNHPRKRKSRKNQFR